MSENLRFKAIEEVISRKLVQSTQPECKVSEIFCSQVFSLKEMREYLPEAAFKVLKESTSKGQNIDRNLADQIATSMKEWAISKGATHYTHWFQPLNGLTAEKHDAFFKPLENGYSLEHFEGSQLIQQEPDASSFPSGGIRNTFEARGYTAWDPSSPAFILEKTLCIPTIFISYTGEALDFKMPLLKAIGALDKAATAVCQYFNNDVRKVNATLGWEQEYFLIDEALFYARPDLVLTGRTLFGHSPAKGQQLEDHYFGSISDRVHRFMKDFETEALKLGIPVTTRHNEVAPCQFECAPIFEEVNLANDHNLLLMMLLDKISIKHKLRVLLHEKPYSSLNGSGKHNNWSMQTDTGINLLSPGKNPKTNIRFLTFFINTIKAINENADLLRASIASASNDHRLGANEAPPAIISVFIGSQLTDFLDKLEKSIKPGLQTPKGKTELKFDIGRIPKILLDNTDRNRTSPIAFTGNKFEFRAVGSSANCASAMIIFNTIVANQLKQFKKDVDAQIKKGKKKDEAVLIELRKCITESKKVRFEGNGYGEEWIKDAEKRGLSNLKDTPTALKAYLTPKAIALFKENQVLNERELKARYDIELEGYILKLQIESRTMDDLAQNYIIPSAIKYMNLLLENVEKLVSVYGTTKGKKMATPQLHLIESIDKHLSSLDEDVRKMLQERKKANRISKIEEKAAAYRDNVKEIFPSIRTHCDKLEILIDDTLWTLPKQREMLFIL